MNICNVQRLPLPLNVYPVNNHIFSLQSTNYGCFSPQLLFLCLICLVSVMICIFNSEEFIYGIFEDYIGLLNSPYRFFLCQNLYQVIPLFLWQFSKSVWALFHHKLAQHNFWEFIFNFDARCVSRKFTTYSCLHLCQK